MTDVDYRSPFRTWYVFGDSGEFAYWIDRREAYAKGDDGALVTMLRYVTIDNPPDAPKRRERRHANYGRVALSAAPFLMWAATSASVELTNHTANKPGIAGAVILGAIVCGIIAFVFSVARDVFA